MKITIFKIGYLKLKLNINVINNILLNLIFIKRGEFKPFWTKSWGLATVMANCRKIGYSIDIDRCEKSYVSF